MQGQVTNIALFFAQRKCTKKDGLFVSNIQVSSSFNISVCFFFHFVGCSDVRVTCSLFLFIFFFSHVVEASKQRELVYYCFQIVFLNNTATLTAIKYI